MTWQALDDCTWEVSERDPKSRPLVSVVMLTFNHAPYLAEAIEGVLRQQHGFDVELVISDDCSTDGTTEIALDYQRRYPEIVRVIGAHRNVGMIANHVRLLKAARGEFVAFCEGDDYWTAPDKLLQQVRCMAGHRDVGAVHTAFDRLAHVRGCWRRCADQKLGTIREGSLFHALLERNVMQTCTVMIRGGLIRDYLASGMPIYDYPVGDWPLFLYVSARSRIAFLDRVTAAYRKTPGSQMNSGIRAEMFRARSYLDMSEDFCRRFKAAAEVRLSSRRALTRHLAWTAARAGDAALAREAWNRLEEMGPLSRRDRVRRGIAASELLIRTQQVCVGAKNYMVDVARYR